MLVLSRKKNETIQIGDAIKFVLVEIRGDKARIGIEAPAEVPVHRGEVYLKLRELGQPTADPRLARALAVARQAIEAGRRLAADLGRHDPEFAHWAETIDELDPAA